MNITETLFTNAGRLTLALAVFIPLTSGQSTDRGILESLTFI